MGSSTARLSQYKDKNRVKTLNDFPKVQRAIVSLLLPPPREMPYQAICSALAAEHSQPEIDNALHTLLSEGYLMSFYEDGDVVYALQHMLDETPNKKDEINRPSSPYDILDDLPNEPDA
jgi:hypothetical protein